MTHKKSFGFIDKSLLPSGEYEEILITNKREFLTTGETSHIGCNHCGATAATNVAIYLDDQLDIMKTFMELYKMIGNGPVFFVPRKLKRYFSILNKDLKYCKVKDDVSIVKSINRKNICMLLLARGILDWHYVVCIGYRKYEDGRLYLIIVDGWTKDDIKYYKINDGAVMLSGTAFKIKK